MSSSTRTMNPAHKILQVYCRAVLWLVFFVFTRTECQPTATTTLSQPRNNLAASSIDDLVLFAGGQRTNIAYSSRVDVYNSSSDSWTTATLSSARRDLCSTTVDRFVIFAGGRQSTAVIKFVHLSLIKTNILNSTDMYDSSSGVWSTGTLSTARFGLAATTVGELALFAGGPGFVNTVNRVDIFNASSKQWTTATLSQSRGYLTATSNGTVALFAGGGYVNGALSTVVDSVDIYHGPLDTWSTATLSMARQRLASVTVNNWAIFAGGMDMNISSNRVDIYDYCSGRWTTATLSVARHDLAATAVDSFALFAGGYSRLPNRDDGPQSVVDIYDTSSGLWSTANLSLAVTQLSAATVNDLTFFAGGFTTATSQNIVNIFSSATIYELIGVNASTTSAENKSCSSPNRLPSTTGQTVSSSTDSSISSALSATTASSSVTTEGSSSISTSSTSSSRTSAGLAATVTTAQIVTSTSKEDITDESSPISSSVIIAVATVGGVLLISCTATIIFILKRRRRNRALVFRVDVPLEETQLSDSKSRVEAEHSWEINYSELRIEGALASGAFGVVYRGEWRGAPCVVKKLKFDDKELQKAFFKEANNMKKLRPHPNCVTMLGICTNPRHLCIITEFVDGGSLLDLLRDLAGRLNLPTKLSMMKDVACGMTHLHSENILHCDLAARNMLVLKKSDTFTVKVADFGLSHVVEAETDTESDSTVVPIRWSAPEVLLTRRLSKASDVWAFGILMYEVLEELEPYPSLSNAEVAHKVSKEGYIMTKPIHCPVALYNIMSECWQQKASDRPSFALIHSQLVDLLQQSQDLKSQLKQEEEHQPKPQQPVQSAAYLTLVPDGHHYSTSPDTLQSHTPRNQ